MRRAHPFVVAVIGLACTLLGAFACDRQDARALAPFIAPAAQIGCVLLRAFTSDGGKLEACATAEELAPFIEELLSNRERSPVAEPASRAVLAFSLEAPRRQVARRRCERWVTVPPHDKDGGTDVAR